MTPERVIGRDGQLPWHLPEDLRFFQHTTSGHPIVMGRKTYESIGKPLPRRQNIVLTRGNWHPGPPFVEYANDLPSTMISGPAEPDDFPEALLVHHPHDLQTAPLKGQHIFIIGGAQIYALFLPLLDDLLVSHVFENHPGDTTFPEFEDQFPRHELLERHEAFEVRRYWRS